MKEDENSECSRLRLEFERSPVNKTVLESLGPDLWEGEGLVLP